MKFVERIHKEQRVRHVIMNKLTLTLTILRQFEDTKMIEPKLVRRAIADLEAIVEWLNMQKAKSNKQG